MHDVQATTTRRFTPGTALLSPCEAPSNFAFSRAKPFDLHSPNYGVKIRVIAATLPTRVGAVPRGWHGH
jgi:hypothetical protein